MLLGGFLASCGTIDMLTYDQLVPAELSFPAEIRQVGVVNNMPLCTSTNHNNLVLGVVSGDRIPATEAIAGALADSKYFEEVVICDSALQADDADMTVDPLLSPEKVDCLAENLGVDMLVSLERLWVETTKKEVFYPGWNVPYPVIEAKVTPIVRLYVPGRPQPLHTLSRTDSIYWDLGISLTEHDVLKEAHKIAADNIVKQITPSWIQTERYYFSGGYVEMRDASVYLQEGSWSEAQDMWKELFNRLRKGKSKAKAAYNIALSYEMLGDIEQANKWIQEAGKYAETNSQEGQLIRAYAGELSQRLNEVISLKVQMSRFNDK